MNFGKGSVGLSVGTKGAHYSVNSSGRRTATVGLPGTGLSYSKSLSNKQHKSSEKFNEVQRETEQYVQPKQMKTGIKMTLITIFFGMFGVQRFASGQIGMGLLYLCTCGLFLFGWFYDIAYQLRHMFT